MNSIKMKSFVKIAFVLCFSISVLNMSFAATTTKTKTVVKKVTTPVFTKEINDILKKSFTVGVWIPYWQRDKGVAQATEKIKQIDIVSPFAYEMTPTGTFKDTLKLDQDPYKSLIDTAHANKKLVVPSILWWAVGEQGRSDVDFVLKDSDLRWAIRYDILKAIKDHNLDGIDIDFENKKAETKDAFSTFLTELSKDLHSKKKILVCTIEARTPTDDELAKSTSTKSVERANDFKVIGKVCDQVRVMAYDQDTADASLNAVRTGAYRPVADIYWVKKVIDLAIRDIPAKKLVLGVPTYGYKYEISRDSKGQIATYKRLGSMNWFYADQLAKQLNITPTRHVSGEVYYTYIEASSSKEYLVWYSDAQSIKEKIDLAKLYKLGGVAIFKIDGNNDTSLWTKL
jgi:spore germination protein YaaH